jgi:hypothetical protein
MALGTREDDMTERQSLRLVLHRMGRLVRRHACDVVCYPAMSVAESCRATLGRDRGMVLAVDVGANVDQYPERLRALGCAGRIESLETGGGFE